MERKRSGRHGKLKWLHSMTKCAKKSMDIAQKHRCLCLCQLQLPMSNWQMQLSDSIAFDTKHTRAPSIHSRSVHRNA